MKTSNIKLDKSQLTADFFYSAFLNLPKSEKENFLSRLFSGLNNKAIGYSSSGKPLTTKQYINHIEKISNEVKEGNFISHENILRETNNEQS